MSIGPETQCYMVEVRLQAETGPTFPGSPRALMPLVGDFSALARARRS